MRLRIDSIAYGGDGVARPAPDEPVVFVPRAAAGDELDVEIVQEKPRFRRARALRIASPGPDRVPPPCPYYGGTVPPSDAEACGGCQVQHLGYQAQLATKAEQVGEAIRRIGGLEPEIRPAVAAPAPFGYRNKGTFHWSEAAGRFGLVALDGRTVLPIDRCPLLVDPSNDVYRAAADAAEELAKKDPRVRRALATLVVRAAATGETLACLVAKPNAPASLADDFAQGVLARREATTTVLLNRNPKPDKQLFGDEFLVGKGDGTIRERIGAITFVLDPESFLQVNTEQAAALFGLAAAEASLSGAERVLDLYGGSGGIALTVAGRAAEVLVVESAEAAVLRGAQSADANGIANVRFRTGRAETLLGEAAAFAPDVVFVDPPRAGLDAKVVDATAAMKPERLVYVSCNPATLARDLKRYAENGYQVRRVTPVDLFPQTYHVECVALLTPS